MVKEGSQEPTSSSDQMRRAGQNLYVRDRGQFVQQVPALIARLRMRKPANAWSLDLTPSSLRIVDSYLTEEVNTILERHQRIGEVIDPEFVAQLVAYVGEVMARHKNGRWTVSDSAASGPLIIFRVSSMSAYGSESTRDKAVDIYEQVVRIVLEGESLVRWYHQEAT